MAATSSSPKANFFGIDEDLVFVIDSYQTAMTPIPTNSKESRARRKIMKRIASKRAPRVVPLLDQIENITKAVERQEMSLVKALNKLASISQKYGDPDLHAGIMSKIQQIKGTQQAPKQRAEKNIAMFSNIQKNTQNMEKTLAKNFQPRMKKPRKKTKKAARQRWDPLNDEHPMALWFRRQK
ncbi:MAG: hypothetical protein ACOC80_12055 [Petrotogales bacterium]